MLQHCPKLPLFTSLLQTFRQWNLTNIPNSSRWSSPTGPKWYKWWASEATTKPVGHLPRKASSSPRLWSKVSPSVVRIGGFNKVQYPNWKLTKKIWCKYRKPYTHNKTTLDRLTTKNYFDRTFVFAQVTQISKTTKVSGGITKQDITIADSTEQSSWHCKRPILASWQRTPLIILQTWWLSHTKGASTIQCHNLTVLKGYANDTCKHFLSANFLSLDWRTWTCKPFRLNPNNNN